MRLFLLGAGMGMVGGTLPSPLRLMALAQAIHRRWGRALFVLFAPTLAVDGAFLIVTWFFLHLISPHITRYVAYFGGLVLIAYAGYKLWTMRGNVPNHLAGDGFTATSIGVATFAEVATPGNWIYWLTIAGPVLAEGRARGLAHIAPFFIGALGGYYGASVFSTWLLAWGGERHREFGRLLFRAGNLLLLLMGVFYLVHAV